MARPRSYDRQQAVFAAKEVFWRQGYQKTGIGDLEEATGLSRSSLYLEFGSKRGLFNAALDDYQHSFIDVVLGPVERDGAGLSEAAGFFMTLATFFRDVDSERGCLQINSMTELAGRDPTFASRGPQLADRYRSAFSNALLAAAAQGAMGQRDVIRRAELLTAAAMGVWVAVRADRRAAVAASRAIASEIRTWAPSQRAAQG